MSPILTNHATPGARVKLSILHPETAIASNRPSVELGAIAVHVVEVAACRVLTAFHTATGMRTMRHQHEVQQQQLSGARRHGCTRR